MRLSEQQKSLQDSQDRLVNVIETFIENTVFGQSVHESMKMLTPARSGAINQNTNYYPDLSQAKTPQQLLTAIKEMRTTSPLKKEKDECITLEALIEKTLKDKLDGGH